MPSNAPKSDLPVPTSDQASNVKIRGGMPPKKDVSGIASVNTPSGRKPAPESFRP